VLSESEAHEAIVGGVNTVLDFTTKFSEAESFCGVKYRHLPVFDLTAPTQAQLGKAADFIERESRGGIGLCPLEGWLLPQRRCGGCMAARQKPGHK
jgi:hypothetical protein